MYATVSVLCIVVQYLLYIVVLYRNQCASHNISPPPSTQHMYGCATTVGWLLIMTTVGKTHAVRSNTDYTYTLLNNCLKQSGASKIIIIKAYQAQSSPRKKPYS